MSMYIYRCHHMSCLSSLDICLKRAMYVDIRLYNGAAATQQLTMSRWPVYIFILILSAAALFQPDKTAVNNQIIPNPGRQDSCFYCLSATSSLYLRLDGGKPE